MCIKVSCLWKNNTEWSLRRKWRTAGRTKDSDRVRESEWGSEWRRFQWMCLQAAWMSCQHNYLCYNLSSSVPYASNGCSMKSREHLNRKHSPLMLWIQSDCFSTPTEDAEAHLLPHCVHSKTTAFTICGWCSHGLPSRVMAVPPDDLWYLLDHLSCLICTWKRVPRERGGEGERAQQRGWQEKSRETIQTKKRHKYFICQMRERKFVLKLKSLIREEWPCAETPSKPACIDESSKFDDQTELRNVSRCFRHLTDIFLRKLCSGCSRIAQRHCK